jgi:WD40 repeat protein
VFVSGGGDRLMKLWHYDDGAVMAVGVGHSGTITKAAISPDSRTIVSVGEEGAILLWTMPGH